MTIIINKKYYTSLCFVSEKPDLNKKNSNKHFLIPSP